MLTQYDYIEEGSYWILITQTKSVFIIKILRRSSSLEFDAEFVYEKWAGNRTDIKSGKSVSISADFLEKHYRPIDKEMVELLYL